MRTPRMLAILMLALSVPFVARGAGDGVFPDELDIVPSNPQDVSVAEQQQNFLNWLSATFQLLGAQTAQDVTISSGTITPTRAIVEVETQAAASSDNLDHASVSSMEEGRFLVLRANNTTRTVVVRDSQGGSGQFLTSDGGDFSLDSTEKTIAFYRSGTNWIEVFRNYALPVSTTAGNNSIPASDGTGKIDTGYIDRTETATGWVLLDEQIASGASTVDFESLIDGNYDRYRVELLNVSPGTDAVNFHARLSTNNGTSYLSSGYDWVASIQTVGGGTPATTANGANNTSDIVLQGYGFFALGNASNREKVTGWIELERGSAFHHPRVEASLCFTNSAGVDLTQVRTWAQYRGATTAVNALRLLMSSGTLSGTFRLYGLKK